jgi:DNA modification methylase
VIGIGGEDFRNRIYCGDVREQIRRVPDESVDLVFTDPPYNISTDFSVKFDDRADISHDFGDWDYNQIKPEDWISEAKRVLKPEGVLIAFYDNRRMNQLISEIESNNLIVRQKLYWHKQNPVPQIHGVKWMESVEEAVITTVNEGKGHHFQNQRKQRHNLIETPLCGGNERLDHPTQKPKSLARPVINWWTQPSDHILDPFTGTGTFCVVAQELGRHYTGIDKQEKHVKTARKRLEQESLHQFR